MGGGGREEEEGIGVEGMGGGQEGSVIMSFLPESRHDKNGCSLFLELRSLATSVLNGLINVAESLSVFPTQVTVWLTSSSTLSR